MKIIIPDDYQDMVDQLPCFSLIRHHDVTRYRAPQRRTSTSWLLRAQKDADVVVSIRERVEFSARCWSACRSSSCWPSSADNSHMLDFNAATDLGIPVSTGVSNSPVAPAELTLALIVASRRNVALEAERMKRGDWPCTLSHRLRGSTLGIFGLGAIGVAGRRRRQGARHEGAGLGPEELAGEGRGCGLRDREQQGRAVRTLRRSVAQHPAAARRPRASSVPRISRG